MYWASPQETFKGIKYFNCVRCKKMHIKHAEWLACSQILGATLYLTAQAAVDVWKPPHTRSGFTPKLGETILTVLSFRPRWRSRNPRWAHPHSPKADSTENKLSNLHPSLSISSGEEFVLSKKYFTTPFRRKNKEEWAAAIKSVQASMSSFLIWIITSGVPVCGSRPRVFIWESCMKLYDTYIPWSHWTWFSSFKETSRWVKFWLKRES